MFLTKRRHDKRMNNLERMFGILLLLVSGCTFEEVKYPSEKIIRFGIMQATKNVYLHDFFDF